MTVYNALDSRYLVFAGGVDLSFTVQFLDARDNAVTPVTASFQLLDAADAVLIASTPIDPASITGTPPSTIITIPGAQHTVIAGQRLYRVLRVTYTDANSNIYVRDTEYFVESLTSLVSGTNSFGNKAALLDAAIRRLNLDAFHAAGDRDRTLALITAYENISRLTIPLKAFVERDVYSTSEITAAELETLEVKLKSDLLSAQVIEANAVLGGNPVEDRRRMGLLSNSVGEVSQFFRVVKPLALPVARETALVLGRYVRWSPVLARG